MMNRTLLEMDQSVHTCRQQLLQRRRLVQRFIVRKSQRKQIVMTAQHPLVAVDDAGKNIIVQIRGQHTDSAGAGFAAVHPAGILLTYERAAPRRPLQQPLLLKAADLSGPSAIAVTADIWAVPYLILLDLPLSLLHLLL